MNFKGTAFPITDDDFARAAADLKVEEAAIRSVVEVEASGKGFGASGRPKMLFEPHVFYRLLGEGDARDRAVELGLAYARWGAKPYPKDSYARLERALDIDAAIALQACSWGLGQIMGEYFAHLGYANPAAMVLDVCASEGKQLDQMVAFLRWKKLDAAMRRKDWAALARGYNGAGYAKNAYDRKLAAAYAKWSKKRPVRPRAVEVDLSKFEVQALQQQLDELGYHQVGKPDGIWGGNTVAAVSAFQHDNEIDINGRLDDATREALKNAQPKPIAEERATATTVEGSRTISVANVMKGAGGTGVGFAALGGYVDQAQDAKTKIDQGLAVASSYSDLLAPMTGFLSHHPLLIVGAFAAVMAVGGFMIHSFRLQDHRAGKLA